MVAAAAKESATKGSTVWWPPVASQSSLGTGWSVTKQAAKPVSAIPTPPAPAPAVAPPPAPAAPAPAPAAPIAAQVPRPIGVVTHFYPHAGAGIVAIESGELRVGDTVHFRGHTTDYYQRVDRIEVDHRPVEVAHAGETVGIHVSQRVREGDTVSIVST